MSASVRPHGLQPLRLLSPWDSPGKNTGVGCHFLLQCMKVESESEVTQSCPTLSNPMDCSLPGSSIHGIFQARVLEWGAIAFSLFTTNSLPLTFLCLPLGLLTLLMKSVTDTIDPYYSQLNKHLVSASKILKSGCVQIEVTFFYWEEQRKLMMSKENTLVSII